ncbi:MAG TPA: hypothetical protein VM285_17425 [Polyangia bacterium]|nr:hypothetical protein [Polyangia bacterium]
MYRIAVALAVVLAWGCESAPAPTREDPRGALARLGPCVDRGDAACLFGELDRDSRWSVETIHRALVEGRALVGRSYPEQSRPAALGAWNEAARAETPAGCFAALAAARGWPARVAAGLGAAVEVRETGPGAAEVTTTRGQRFPFAARDGEWGLSLWAAELGRDKLRVLDNLEQIRRNAREFDEQRAARGDEPRKEE